MSEKRFPKIMQGVVVSDGMDKTVVVKVTRLKKHPLYKKYFKSSKRYSAHDAENKFHVGEKCVFKNLALYLKISTGSL